MITILIILALYAVAVTLIAIGANGTARERKLDNDDLKSDIKALKQDKDAIINDVEIALHDAFLLDVCYRGASNQILLMTPEFDALRAKEAKRKQQFSEANQKRLERLREKRMLEEYPLPDRYHNNCKHYDNDNCILNDECHALMTDVKDRPLWEPNAPKVEEK